MGIAHNESDAVENARRDAIRTSMSQGGLIDYEGDLEGIIRANRIAREPRCQTPAIHLGNGQIKVYVLYKIPKRASDIPDPDPNFNCRDREFEQNLRAWNYGEYPFSARVFVPGMAQIHKGSKEKGTIFIAAQVATIGGIVIAEMARSSAEASIRSARNPTDRQYYINRESSMQSMRNICIAAAVAVYAWNVIDGIVAKGERRVQVQRNHSFVPHIAPQGRNLTAGVSLTFTF
jgi:hypothetical protein